MKPLYLILLLVLAAATSEARVVEQGLILDLDADNDLIPDALEANGGTVPSNMTAEGQFTTLADSSPVVPINSSGGRRCGSSAT